MSCRDDRGRGGYAVKAEGVCLRTYGLRTVYVRVHLFWGGIPHSGRIHRGRFRTARAQRQLLRCSSWEHPCKPPPYRSMRDPFKTASGVQNSGPLDPWRPVVENSRLFAQRDSRRCARGVAHRVVGPQGTPTNGVARAPAVRGTRWPRGHALVRGFCCAPAECLPETNTPPPALHSAPDNTPKSVNAAVSRSGSAFRFTRPFASSLPPPLLFEVMCR